MKALLIIAVTVGLTFGQGLGKLTTQGQEYKPIIDTITSLYNQQQKEYDQINHGSPMYQWKFMDVSQFPYWCSDTIFNKAGISVQIDDKATTVLWSRKKDVDKIQVVAMNWTTNKTYPERRFVRMFFFKKVSDKWVMEREPAKMTVRLNREPFYLYCE